VLSAQFFNVAQAHGYYDDHGGDDYDDLIADFVDMMWRARMRQAFREHMTFHTGAGAGYGYSYGYGAVIVEYCG
jgi:hypothetical protein